ncbi:LysR family transcriptional regulator [Enterobacter sp. Acro-832]|uniref:LysR family transcriptional regulator n=1 Tax=Enterobacter sp. Acro-832 TaxID=2608348 RepID=UPI00141ED286|nr:LysR family transcriptional regulator [Enterobacter sp. Acro-832]NIG46443.1 LysR family transcriptional regulator [Enterobacter sp. Acro-832]
MNNAEFSELAVFASVAKHRSFSRAATERGTSGSAVSHSIRSLEQRVGVQLFNRTTRSVSLTDAGAALYARLEPAMADVRAALDELNLYRTSPVGTVRITIPNSMAPFVMEYVVDLLKRNSGLKIEVVATDALVDIVQEGYDAGIRFGERLSPDMIAVRIKPTFRFIVVGAPDYFEQFGKPATPDDLQKHNCIRYAFPSGALFSWEFQRHGKTISVDIDGALTVDSQEAMAQSAAYGLGLAYIWEARAASYLKNGSLTRCLEEWYPPAESAYLYFRRREHQSAGLRALIDAMKA